MSSWTIDGFNILNNQSFYYRVGNGSLNLPLTTISATPGVSGTGGILDTTYANSSLSVDILYSLRGGTLGSGVADLVEQITIVNLLPTTLTGFHFFQFASFVGNGNVDFTINSRGLVNEAYVAGGGLTVNENVDTGVTPANHSESLANSYANLTGTMNYQLADNGDGNGTGLWILEWDKDISAGSTLIVSKDLGATWIQPVPEPAIWSLIVIGLGALGASRLRFHRAK